MVLTLGWFVLFRMIFLMKPSSSNGWVSKSTFFPILSVILVKFVFMMVEISEGYEIILSFSSNWIWHDEFIHLLV